MYHVRAVTQTDVVRVGTKEVAKIFQLLYDIDGVSGAGAGSHLGTSTEQLNRTLTTKRGDSMSLYSGNASSNLSGSQNYLFNDTASESGLGSSRANSCDVCSKPLWDIFNPPLALECQSIIFKFF